MTGSPVRLLLVEDHFMARIALRSILGGRSDVSVVAETDSGPEAIRLYGKLRPDVTIMDLGLPDLSGFEAIEAIRRQDRGARIVVLTNFEGSEDVYRALRSGAMAYLTKDTSGQELVAAIMSVHQGVRYLPRSVRDTLAERVPCCRAHTPRASGTGPDRARQQQPGNRVESADCREDSPLPRQQPAGQAGSP